MGENKKRRCWWKTGAVAASLFFVLGGAGLFFFYRQGLQPVSSLDKPQMFVVSYGEGISSVGGRLVKAGLIRNKLIFLLEAKRSGLEERLTPGDFRLSPSMTLREIILTLGEGNVDVWITIIPGWRWEQVALALQEKLTTFDSSWLEVLREKDGFLCPDSYLVPKEADARLFLDIIERNYKKKVSPLVAQAKERGLTEKELITLASLVEREAGDEEGRLIVAQVLLNRLKKDWPLQVDATIQYAVASVNCADFLNKKCRWWPRISGAQTREVDSPFNTYLYRGLPPAPICNPSLQSIEAVLKAPLNSPYWYYFSDEKGIIHPSRTLQEHNEGVKALSFLSLVKQSFIFLI